MSVLGTSRKEERVLTPGAVCRGELGVMESRGEALLVDVEAGAGGGDGHDEDVLLGEELCADGCAVGSGAVTPGTAAFLRNVVILSLYASFSFEMSPLWPSALAFSSSSVR